jgi:predicted naringenin-chalcone synthase
MMDLSSVIDAGLVAMGVAAVLLMGLWTLSSESSTVSISESQSTASRDQRHDLAWPKAA